MSIYREELHHKDMVKTALERFASHLRAQRAKVLEQLRRAFQPRP